MVFPKKSGTRMSRPSSTATVTARALSIALRAFVPEDSAGGRSGRATKSVGVKSVSAAKFDAFLRSEEHTSELQSQSNLVCRLLLEINNQHLLHLAAGSEPYLDFRLDLLQLVDGLRDVNRIQLVFAYSVGQDFEQDRGLERHSVHGT